MPNIFPPPKGFHISADGLISESFYAWVVAVSDAVTNTEPLTGTGTPEAAVIANVGRWYVDTGAAAGTGIYFKETGTGDTGWVLRS